MCLVLLMCTLTIYSFVLCVLMVEGMFVVVNVMVFPKSVMSPSPDLCDHWVYGGKVMYFDSVCFMVELD